MKRLAALLAIAVACGAMFLTSAAGAREPTKIEKCQTISHPGSYELVNNLVATGDCLVITADFVTIDLAGFSITRGGGGGGETGILALPSSGYRWRLRSALQALPAARGALTISSTLRARTAVASFCRNAPLNKINGERVPV